MSDVTLTSLSPETMATTAIGNQSMYDRYPDLISQMEVFCPQALIIDRLVTPIWYIIGLHGNILAAKIWLEPRMRRNNSSAIYLATISITDMIFLMLHVLLELKYAWNVNSLSAPVLCEGFFFLYLSAQYMAPMLVLGFSLERWIAVCRPFVKEQYCTTRRAKMVACGLVLISLALCSMQAYFYTYDWKSEQCILRESVWKDQPPGRSFWDIWTWVTEMLVFLVLPMIILGFNILVIMEVRRMSKTGPPYLPGTNGTGGGGGGQSSSRATTTMLLLVSMYLIVTTLPATLVYTMNDHFPEGDLSFTDEQIRQDGTWNKYWTYLTVRKIIEEICLSHYACNFFLYALTGHHFRNAVKDTYNCAGCLNKDNKLAHLGYTHNNSCATNQHNAALLTRTTQMKQSHV